MGISPSGYVIQDEDWNDITEYHRNLFKITLVGDKQVGKTSLLERVIGHEIPAEYIPTVGVDFRVHRIVVASTPPTIISLQIWDTTGNEASRSIVQSYTRGYAIILVFDVSNKNSFDNVKSWAELASIDGNCGPPAVLVGNKCDLHDNRAVTVTMGEEMARELGIRRYIDVSAKANIRVDDAFATLLADRSLIYI
mmetsp:Transcript_26619/g.39551  ORF Transcript_26619/g.39551 Transcript_26619/m.39551 type:complete len:195 (-) Transcript_26619:209-793(-)|eukprot:CAMPEP_0185017694 /NCGR_PEP_ID=MMETSP1103-20130426/608_1 /TAXON_ID=36769 /ORGANISM="Paraphysomonas bandaiensis, Strain Caron Lab Isolate" /LENGTH=194 /DNA_ID=CAMNT_0027547219 /DNA_START=132 /DNA_END=716 /DNA_ORIENTATION=-